MSLTDEGPRISSDLMSAAEKSDLSQFESHVYVMMTYFLKVTLKEVL